MLHIGTWFWGSKYTHEYVRKLRVGVARHVEQPYVFHVFTPQPEDYELTITPGCFARLRSFDPAWQQAHGIQEGERLVTLDLDVVVTGALDPLFDRPEPFVILQGVNASNPCPFNGSIWMTIGGYRPDVWSTFSLGAVRTMPHYEFPDDQQVFFHMMPDAGAWTAADDVYAFQKRGWPGGRDLPVGARLVTFPGYRDPGLFHFVPWVQEHWRA